MRTSLVLAFVLSFMTFKLPASEVPGAISFQGAPVTQVLQVYKDLTGLTLVVDSRVKALPYAIKIVTNRAGKAEATKLVEQSLLEQAGVVITHLDAKRVSVTYNDALPAKPAGIASPARKLFHPPAQAPAPPDKKSGADLR